MKNKLGQITIVSLIIVIAGLVLYGFRNSNPIAAENIAKPTIQPTDIPTDIPSDTPTEIPISPFPTDTPFPTPTDAIAAQNQLYDQCIDAFNQKEQNDPKVAQQKADFATVTNPNATQAEKDQATNELGGLGGLNAYVSTEYDLNSEWAWCQSYSEGNITLNSALNYQLNFINP